MDITFNSLKELYEKVTPALRAKVSELKKCGITYVKEADIWNYLTETKWKKSRELTLLDMVNDIFDMKAIDIKNYITKKVSLETRNPDLTE